MASPQATRVREAFKRYNEQVLSDPNAPLDEIRRKAGAIGELTGEPAGVTYAKADAGGVPALWATAAGGASDRVLQYTHGGGYVFCSVETHRKLTGHLASALGCRVLSLDYRLAPEHPHPAPVTDAVAAYRWLLAQGVTPDHIALAGDSAGGGLCVATLLKLRDEGLPLPAAAVPLSPWVDLEATGASMKSRAAVDMIVSEAGIKSLAPLFLAGQDPRTPLAAPLHADLRGLPPLYVQVGDEETLLDDSLRLAERARAAGVEVRVDVFPEMQHIFQIAAGNLPEADDAIARIASWLRPRLGL